MPAFEAMARRTPEACEQLHRIGIGDGVALPHARNALVGLARISRGLRNPKVRQELLAAGSAERVLAIIREAEGTL
jgi:mannitol/fructose-specific phosphotransferase system IIA component (Ntr-type)